MELCALTVTATLPHGICQGRPWGTSLDGILASIIWHHAKAAAAARGELLTYDPTVIPDDLDLPLARCTTATPWHWMCTFADLDTRDPHPDIRPRTRRTDHRDLHRLSPTVSSTVSDTRGRYRSRSTPTIATTATSAIWRAVGDPERIRALLSGVHAIGKHRNTGEGTVSAWHITDTPDTDWWSAGHEHHHNVLGRATPTACLSDHPATATGALAHTGVRAPYLHPSRHTTAHLPAA